MIKLAIVILGIWNIGLTIAVGTLYNRSKDTGTWHN